MVCTKCGNLLTPDDLARSVRVRFSGVYCTACFDAGSRSFLGAVFGPVAPPIADDLGPPLVAEVERDNALASLDQVSELCVWLLHAMAAALGERPADLAERLALRADRRFIGQALAEMANKIRSVG